MLLEERFAMVWVEGEISNLAQPRSGHWYFTLKDGSAQIRCAMFAGRNRTVRFPVRDGLKVVLRGRISLYEARGDFQLIAEGLEPAGEGALRAAYEALKAKLDEEGLFAPERKRPLPAAPAAIALITSPTGAVIRDFLKVLARRYPAATVTVLPVPVQGDAAGPAIVSALEQLAERQVSGTQRCDLVVLARGGGSLEDLWAFNLESVARAIAASAVPVVSAIGHQTDFTIADLVADLRAPTPSAAAEMIAPDQQALRQQLQQLGGRLRTLQLARLRLASAELARARAALTSPASALQQRMQRSDELAQRLHRATAMMLSSRAARLAAVRQAVRAQSPGRQLDALARTLAQFGQRLMRAEHAERARRQQQLAATARTLAAVSPLNTLSRGYAVVRAADGRVIDQVRKAADGDALQVLLADGQLEVSVTARSEEPPLSADPLR